MIQIYFNKDNLADHKYEYMDSSLWLPNADSDLYGSVNVVL